MNKMQFTFYEPNHHYKPITVTIKINNDKEKISQLYHRAVQKACVERNWTINDMVKVYGYTKYCYRLLKE